MSKFNVVDGEDVEKALATGRQISITRGDIGKPSTAKAPACENANSAESGSPAVECRWRKGFHYGQPQEAAGTEVPTSQTDRRI